MPLSSPFRRRQPSKPEQAASPSSTSSTFSDETLYSSAYAARLWKWAADANRSRLSDITLAHVLSGDTVPPISLSDLEAFLAFCDISLENLQFIAWFQDYRTRFDALPRDIQARAQPPPRSDPRNDRVPTWSSSPTNTCDASGFSVSGLELSHKENVDGKGSTAHARTLCRLASTARKSPPPPLKLSSSRTSSVILQTPLSPTPEYTQEAHPISECDDQIKELDMHSFYSYAASGSSSQAPFFSSSPTSSMFSPYPPAEHRPVHLTAQPFRAEIQNILATFFVPSAKKELLLSAEMRDRTIKEAGQTTHPDVFLHAYETIYESVETVSLPRFLAHASTNINRPRQLFWYFSALPTFLLGIAVALWLIMSPSRHLRVPPESHRAWRLFAVPLFLLASMMWYKGFRGFCPILFLRSSTQLRVWELEAMDDDEEAQTYCAALASDEWKETDGFPMTPVSASSPITRIAPFLDGSKHESKAEGVRVDATSASSVDLGPASDSDSRPARSANNNAQFRPRARSLFHRPPIFGPERIVEDARIRAVHTHLWWALVRFGLFWAAVSGAIVVSVPSWHVS